MTILVTGGAGFIGSNFVLDWVAQNDEPVVNVDKLTYAGNLQNFAGIEDDRRHIFVHGDIGDAALISKLLSEHKPRAILNFAAGSHMDRSIHGPADFIHSNVVGTFNPLETVRAYWGAAWGYFLHWRYKDKLLNYNMESGWGTWIRTKIDGVRVRCSTIELFPNGAKRRGRPSVSGLITKKIAACKYPL